MKIQKSLKKKEFDFFLLQPNGTCAACNSNITQETTECKAMGKIFHVNCFKCKKCGIKLASFSSYYRVDDYPLCESCYQVSDYIKR
ncbi:LIM domain protein [Necator americanus]|uniref:LIM domain protein n=1 Tax=Necator americanus TaxID=51031 RepID=W2SWF3_NECAM|nr:LIM domain protein [Necator americanus]ETN73955.1 LIM domain protein [Necator americanus]